jgi:aspartate/methionine/tyrosine aminotransferase
VVLSVPLPDFELEVYLGRWEFAAAHYLTGSDGQTRTISELLALASDEEREAFEQLALGYTPTWGTDRLLAAIATTYESIGPENVLTFAGAEEAIFWAIQELVGPGDHAVVAVPTYQATESIALATGAHVSGLLLRRADGWGLDLDELEHLLRPNTRLVAVNFPNNPTGGMPDPQAFRRLVELCDEREITVFSDEVYRGVEHGPGRALPQAADLSARAISLNVMSKAYGLPGLRIGWLASPNRPLLEHLERRKHYTSICNSAPSELLAAIALANGEAVRGRIRSIIAENLPIFDSFFVHWSDYFEWEHPQGGCVCFPRYLGGDGVEAFCQDLLHDAGVVLLPASIFRSALADVPHDHFRIGVARKHPGPALAAFDDYLSRRGCVG